MCFNLTHARHDPAHCLLPIFRSLRRGERKKLKLDVTCDFGSHRLRFWGPEPLGADDLRVLQGLVAMSAVSGADNQPLMLHPEPKTEVGQKLRALLETKFDSAHDSAIAVKSSYRQLAREIGYADVDGGATFKTIRACIERMWAVSVIIESEGKRQGFRLLSDYASDESDGRLFVALNPRLADAIVGRTQYLRINMGEVRSLKTASARLMHQRLHWINEGSSGRVTFDTLCSYIWPDETTPGALKKRKQIAREALDEINKVGGWTYQEYAKGKFIIRRLAQKS